MFMPSQCKRDGNTPSYPIFSSVKDPMVRALLAVVVGCDACPGGGFAQIKVQLLQIDF
jgi:hypothetical protein